MRVDPIIKKVKKQLNPYVETEPLSITFLTLFKTQDTIPMY